MKRSFKKLRLQLVSTLSSSHHIELDAPDHPLTSYRRHVGPSRFSLGVAGAPSSQVNSTLPKARPNDGTYEQDPTRCVGKIQTVTSACPELTEKEV